MDNVEIRLLRVFSVLLAERSVSRAAERLELSQPATSHALARLRTLFQDPLLLRSREGMVPTPRAVELGRRLGVMLTEYDRLVAPPEPFRPASSRRSFVLTATEYTEFVLLPSIMAEVRRRAPQVEIEIRNPDRERVFDWLESGEIDLRIGWLQNPTPSLRSQSLFQDRLVCLVRRDHPEIRGALSVAQYLRLPHVRPQILGRTTIGDAIDAAVAAQRGQLRLVLRLQNFLTIPYLVAQSDMIATLPRRLALTFTPQLPLQMLEPPLRLPRMRYAAYWHDRNQKDPGHEWLRRTVLEAARKLSPIR